MSRFLPIYSILATAEPAAHAATMRRLRAWGEPDSRGEVEAAQRRGLGVTRVGNAAVIPVRGVMMPGGDPYWNEVDTRELVQLVNAAAADDDVAGTVVILETPGGSAIGMAELVDAVQAHARVKSIAMQVEGYAASAGYMMAAAGTEIIAHRMDEVGSIGTRLLTYDFSKWMEERGIVPVAIDTGKFKSAGAFGLPITDEHKAEWQRLVDAFFADFLGTVVQGRARKMSAEAVKAAADGRMFSATQAMQMGLIDRIGTTAETISRYAKMTTQNETLGRIRATLAT